MLRCGVTLSETTATCTTSWKTLGSHDISATHRGHSNTDSIVATLTEKDEAALGVAHEVGTGEIREEELQSAGL